MDAGRLRDRVTVRRRAVVNDGGTPVRGDATTTANVIQSRIPAEIRQASGARLERLFASQVQGVATHEVHIRQGRSWAVRLGDELVWHDAVGDRVLNVVGVADPDGRRVEWVLAVTERTA